MFFRNKNYGNDSIDVFSKNCFPHYNTLACLTTVLLTIASTITMAFIIFKIFKYYKFRHKQIHHFALFYISALQMLICISNIIIGHKYPQLKFSTSFLKLLQFSIICHLHWWSSAKAHNREDLIQHVINPGLCLYMIYCTTVALMGMVDIGTTWNECLKPYWLMLSAADFVIVQCFALAALYISHKTNFLPNLASFKNAQKRDLMTVIVAYELSAIFSVSFDALMRLVGTEEIGCSSVFGHSQFFYSSTELIFNIGKFLLPNWAILAVFQPVESNDRTSDNVISGGYNLEATPTLNGSSIRGIHQYHRMRPPLTPLPIVPFENLTPSLYVNPNSLERPSTPINSNSFSYSKNKSNLIGFTNHITLNCNPYENGEKFMGPYHHRGLTTISEESIINVADPSERISIRSEKSGSSHY